MKPSCKLKLKKMLQVKKRGYLSLVFQYFSFKLSLQTKNVLTIVMSKNSKVKGGYFDHFENFTFFFLSSKRSVKTDFSYFNKMVFPGGKKSLISSEISTET